MAEGVPWVVVDGVLVEHGKILCVVRGREPFRGELALPGGNVELGETVETAVRREFLEETGLTVTVRSLIGVYSDPRRDPRAHAITFSYEVARERPGKAVAGTDASAVAWLPVDPLPHLAFDHTQILADYLRRRGG